MARRRSCASFPQAARGTKVHTGQDVSAREQLHSHEELQTRSAWRLVVFYAYCCSTILMALSLDVLFGNQRERNMTSFFGWPMFLFTLWVTKIFGHANVALLAVPLGGYMIGGKWFSVVSVVTTLPASGSVLCLAGLLVPRLEAGIRRRVATFARLMQVPRSCSKPLLQPLPYLPLAPVCLYNLASEILVIGCAVLGMFPAASLLRWAGGSPSDDAAAKCPTTRRLIVLLHGLGGQEGQYCMGRVHLALANPSLPPVISVNFHSEGRLNTDWRPEHTIEDFAATLAAKLEPYTRKNDSTEKVELIFVGHSLGCIMSAYFSQHYAEGMGFRVGLVVACSGPFLGSDILASLTRRASAIGNDCFSGVVRSVASALVSQEKAIFADLQPSSPSLARLREHMRAGQVRYRCITGQLDPLVRPASAAFNGEVVVLPHCGHFNNMLSVLTWRQQIDWIVEHCRCADGEM
eukprot:TRINITY_DN20332_c0_g1_i2.p1 TRINITY_DN20332_c0_g1~~TRINITY_DN20332_c0_g1_i2.p1  ORF type:complete len:463 (-),score=54.90 TRINITY_DN20332_c0_g1_i2:74-1462(-)